MTKPILFGAGALALLVSPACAPEKLECVCQCDNPPPGVTIQGRTPAAGGATVASASPTPAPGAGAAPTPARPAPAAPAEPGDARGSVSAEPGSGTPVTLDEAEKKQMAESFKKFIEAAKTKNLAEMRKYTTERLGSSLERSMPKYEERFFRGLDPAIKSLASGVTVTEVRDTGRGNMDVQIKFGDGTERRPIFFKEDGAWKLNRL